MKRGVPIEAQVTVSRPWSMACLAGAVAGLAVPPTGVTEGLLGTLFHTLTTWKDKATEREKRLTLCSTAFYISHWKIGIPS